MNNKRQVSPGAKLALAGVTGIVAGMYLVEGVGYLANVTAMSPGGVYTVPGGVPASLDLDTDYYLSPIPNVDSATLTYLDINGEPSSVRVDITGLPDDAVVSLFELASSREHVARIHVDDTGRVVAIEYGQAQGRSE